VRLGRNGAARPERCGSATTGVVDVLLRQLGRPVDTQMVGLLRLAVRLGGRAVEQDDAPQDELGHPAAEQPLDVPAMAWPTSRP